MSKLGKFFDVVKFFAPLILSRTKLAPIADEVAEGISIAEQLKGASGAEKLAAAKRYAVLAAKAKNDVAGKEVLSVAEVEAAADTVISGAVNSVNHIKAIHVDPPAVEPAA